MIHTAYVRGSRSAAGDTNKENARGCMCMWYVHAWSKPGDSRRGINNLGRTFLRVRDVWDHLVQIGNDPHLAANAALALELRQNSTTQRCWWWIRWLAFVTLSLIITITTTTITHHHHRHDPHHRPPGLCCEWRPPTCLWPPLTTRD